MTDGRKTDQAMTCDAVERFLETDLAGGLAPDEENRLARHLTGCSHCAAEVAVAERVELELAALPAFDAPAELIARIKAIPTRRYAPVIALASRRPRRFGHFAALAAALLAALAIGWSQVKEAAPPSRAEVAAAEQEARYALALIARIGRRASEELRQEVLVERVAAPVVKSMGRSLSRDETAKTGGLKS